LGNLTEAKSRMKETPSSDHGVHFDPDLDADLLVTNLRRNDLDNVDLTFFVMTLEPRLAAHVIGHLLYEFFGGSGFD